MKDKTTAGLLAFFLGGFGIHWFYLNRSSRGIFYLLFFWTLIPAIIAFFDALVFFTMDPNKFNQTYVEGDAVAYGGSSQKHNVAEELEKLHALKEKGIITQEEFDKKKKQLL